MIPVRPVQHTTTKAHLEPNLDILRSVAVAAVLVAHALQATAKCKVGDHYAYGVETFSLGSIGVLLFFVHTSLVLMQSLERTGRNLQGWPLLKHFYIRRVFRIYPLSVCLILFSILLSIPPNALNSVYEWRGARWALSNLLLIQNITGASNVSTPLWSLPYEVQMYLFLPVLFLLLNSASKAGVRLGLIYVVSVILSIIHPLFRYFPCFLAGVIAYKLIAWVRPRVPARFWCPTIIGVAVLYILAPYDDSGRAKDIVVCLTAGALIPLFHRSAGAIATAASHVAKYSYGIYLCHTPVLWLLYRHLTIPDWQRPILLVIGTGCASVACYHAIEHPLIQLGTRLANRAAVQRMPEASRAERPTSAAVELPG